MVNKRYFDRLAIRKGFESEKQRHMIYMVLRERREKQRGEKNVIRT